MSWDSTYPELFDMAHRSRASKQSESGLREPKLKVLWNFFDFFEKSRFFSEKIRNFGIRPFWWQIRIRRKKLCTEHRSKRKTIGKNIAFSQNYIFTKNQKKNQGKIQIQGKNRKTVLQMERALRARSIFTRFFGFFLGFEFFPDFFFFDFWWKCNFGWKLCFFQ